MTSTRENIPPNNRIPFDVERTSIIEFIHRHLNGNPNQEPALLELVSILKENTHRPAKDIIAEWKETPITRNNNETTIAKIINTQAMTQINKILTEERLSKGTTSITRFFTNDCDMYTEMPILFRDNKYGYNQPVWIPLKNSKDYVRNQPSHLFSIFDQFNNVQVKLPHANVIAVHFISAKEFVTISETKIKKWDAESFNLLSSFRLPIPYAIKLTQISIQNNLIVGTAFIPEPPYQSRHSQVIEETFIWNLDLTSGHFTIEKLPKQNFNPNNLTILTNAQIVFAAGNSGLMFFDLQHVKNKWEFKFNKSIEFDLDLEESTCLGHQIKVWPDKNYFVRAYHDLCLWKWDEENKCQLIKTIPGWIVLANTFLPNGGLVFGNALGMHILNPLDPKNIEHIAKTIASASESLHINPDYEICVQLRSMLDRKKGFQTTLEFFELQKNRDFFKAETRQYLDDVLHPLAPGLPVDIVNLVDDYSDIYKFFSPKKNIAPKLTEPLAKEPQPTP